MFFLLLNLNKNIQKDTNNVIKVVTTQLTRYGTVASSTVHETAQPPPPPPQTAAPRVPTGVPPARFNSSDSRTQVRFLQTLNRPSKVNETLW